MECGEEAELIEEIENDKTLPLPVFHFKFSVDRALRFSDMENSVVTDYYHRNEVFSIPGHQKIRRTLSFRGYERGHFRVENVTVLVRDFFMSRLFAQSGREDVGIYVFPKKLDTEKIPSTIAKFGNTSSVSVPLTIVSELKGKLEGQKELLLTAFGVGMTWATGIVPFVDCKISDIVEVEHGQAI